MTAVEGASRRGDGVRLGENAEPSILKALLLFASALALVLLAVFASFRGIFAGELLAAWDANGARVLLGVSAGACLALAGVLRMRSASGLPRPASAAFRALVVAGAAAAVALSAAFAGGMLWFALVAAVAGGALGFALARRLQRPSRASNLALAGALLAATFTLTFASTNTRLRGDGIATLVGWLVADLAWATDLGALAIFGVALAALVFVTLRSASGDARSGIPEAQRAKLGLALDAVATAAAGPILGVAELVPRLVARLAGGSAGLLFPWLCAAVGAAGVACADAISRHLVGGFAPPLNAAVLFATPLFLIWNRAYLRAEVGRASAPLALAEWSAIALYAAFLMAVFAFTSGIVAEAY